MNIQNQDRSAFNDVFSNILSNLSINNINEKKLEIKNIIVKNLEFLIKDLQIHSSENAKYDLLEKQINEIDPQFSNEIHTYVTSIQNMANILSKNDLSQYDKLKLPADFGKVRNIRDPDLRAYILSQLLNKLDSENLSHLKIIQNTFAKLKKEEIIKMGPFLKNLHIDESHGFEDLEEIFQACPNVRSLSINSNLGELPVFPPQCTRLYLEGIEAEELPDLSHIKILKMNKTFVENLNLPNCKILSVSDNSMLKKIHAPILKEATLVNNLILQNFNAPEIKEVSTTNCPQIKFSDILKNCIKFTLFHSDISILPDLPSAKKVIIDSCNQLEILPNLSSVDELHLIKCKKLRKFGELSNHCSIDHRNCPKIDFNSIPLSWRLNSGQLPENLIVNMNELEENPLKVLLDASPWLFSKQGLPKIIFQEADGSLSPGIDAGGLRKNFITLLLANIFAKAKSKDPDQLQFDFEEETGFFTPNMSNSNLMDESQKYGFKAFGALLVECFTKDYVINRYLSPNLLNAILSFSAEELETMPENPIELSELTQLKLLYMLDPKNENAKMLIQPPPNNENDYANFMDLLKFFKYLEIYDDYDRNFYANPAMVHAKAREIFLKGKNQVTAPIAVIAKQMHRITGSQTWNQINTMGINQIQDKIYGKLSREAIIKAIRLESELGISESDVNKTYDLVVNWINDPNTSTQDLQDFLFSFTGLSSLSNANLVVRVFTPSHEKDLLPRGHTCSNTLDLPLGYPDQKVFNEKLRELLALKSIGRV